MANVNKAVISDFSGGMNDINPPDQLKENESVELINLFPGLGGFAAHTRPGTARFNRAPTLAARVTGLHRYVRRDGSKRWLAASGGQIASTGAITVDAKTPAIDAAFVYTGAWAVDPTISTRKSTNAVGAKAVITVVTSGVNQRVEVTVADNHNKNPYTVSYKVDGTEVGPVNMFTIPNPPELRELWHAVFATPGTHTIEVTLSAITTPDRLVLDSVTIKPSDDPFLVVKTGLTAGKEYTFCTWMDALYASNGVEPIQRWKPDSITKVLPATMSTLPGAPIAPYIINFRNMLWAAGGNSTVSYSGIMSETATNPDENWSGSLVSDGGSMSVAADNGEVITGLGYMFNGVVVFKERSTYLWAWNDSDSPKQSGKIELLVPGVGCASHYTIAYYNGSLLFLGQASEGAYAVYRLQGTGIDDIAVKIPNRLQRILANSARKPKAIINDHKYFIAADDGLTNSPERALVFCYDLRRGCWSEVEGWSVGSWAADREVGHMFIGTDKDTGLIYDYPTGSADDGVPIHYRFVSKPLFGKDPFARHRWRAIWADIVGAALGTIGIGMSLDGGTATMAQNSLNVLGFDYWNDGVGLWNDGTNWPSGSSQTHVSMETTGDARTAQVVIDGLTVAPIAIERIGVGFRTRKANY